MPANPCRLLAAVPLRRGGFAWSRRVLVVLLLLGQLLTPAVATHCDIGDAFVYGEQRAAAFIGDGVPAVAAEAGIPDDGGCCDGGCIDCCLHASPVLASQPRLPAPSLVSSVPVPRSLSFVPGDYPVDVRPPIAS